MLPFNEKIEKVYLDKETDYVFCYLKKTIITEPKCDMYEYNKKCYDEGKILHMTHTFGSNSGIGYATKPGSILNSCRYCLDKDKAKEYWLPKEAIKYMQPKKQGTDNMIIPIFTLTVGLIIGVLDLILFYYAIGGV